MCTVLAGVAFVLCNMDKVNMSVAVLPMSKELGWTGLERGLVSSVHCKLRNSRI